MKNSTAEIIYLNFLVLFHGFEKYVYSIDFYEKVVFSCFLTCMRHAAFEFASKIILDEYFVFWGDYSVREKYASKFAVTNDWAVYFNSSCRKFGKVTRSRAYCNVDDAKSEDRESF